MRPWLLFGVVVATGGVAAPVPKAVKKNAPLDGTWKLVEAVYDGSQIDVSRSSLWRFEGESFWLGAKPFKAGFGAELKLVRTDPKYTTHVEYQNIRGNGVVDTYLGLVEVTGDEMKFCYGTRGGSRPSEIAPTAGVTYRVFKRVTGEEKK